MKPPEFFNYQPIGFGFLAAVASSLVFGLLGLIGLVCDPHAFAFSWLFVWLFFATTALGSLFWIVVHHAVDAEWSVVVRRQLENLASLLVPLTLLFLPLVFVAPSLWDWMSPTGRLAPAVVAKQAYLNPAFFWIRTVLYFACFITLAVLLRRRSIAQDADGALRHSLLSRRIAFSGAVPLGLCFTFASVDWVMSLDPRWSSSIWGVYLFSGSVLSALCVLVLLVTALRSVGHLRVVTVEHYHIMGKLLLSFTIFWAYIAFSQYVVIWYANIPEETAYFAARGVGGWRVLSLLLVVGHFFLPFLVLLFRRTKRTPALLCAVAAWLLLMHALDLYLVVLPFLRPASPVPSLWDLVALLALGSILAAIFLKRLGDSSLYPVGDPRLARSLTMKN